MPLIRDLLGLDSATELAALREPFRALIRPSLRAQEVRIAGVACRRIEPATTSRGAYVHLHGGGMVAGSAAMADEANQALADRHGLTVISVDYSLAPEHPHPVAIEEVTAVALAVLEDALAGTAPSQVFIGGESAGAYLAIAAVLRLRDDYGAADLITGVDLSWGIYDWGGSPSQRGVRASQAPDLLDPAGLARSAEWYLPGLSAEERRAPDISPAFADLTGLPRAFLSVGTADHLLDDTLVLSARWAAACGASNVELFVGPDLPHSFPMVPCAMTECWATERDAWWHGVVT